MQTEHLKCSFYFLYQGSASKYPLHFVHDFTGSLTLNIPVHVPSYCICFGFMVSNKIYCNSGNTRPMCNWITDGVFEYCTVAPQLVTDISQYQLLFPLSYLIKPLPKYLNVLGWPSWFVDYLSKEYCQELETILGVPFL